jgi:hypothetical protein
MKASRSVSLETSTWDLIERHMERETHPDVSSAVEDLVLAGADAKKLQRGEKK